MYYFNKNIINIQLYGLQHFYVESATLFGIVKILSIQYPIVWVTTLYVESATLFRIVDTNIYGPHYIIVSRN